MITVAVCDDSKVLVESMETYLKEYGEEMREELKILTFYSGAELLENYNGTYDILFLDIRMLGLDGIEVAEKIRKKDKRVIIIFLTSLIQYALDGYKVNAANYIVKPISKKRLKMEMERWIRELGKKDEPFITFHNDNGNYKVLLKTIRYIETYNRNLLIHTDEENLICYWKMKEMEKKVADNGFARNHASYLTNLYYVESVEKMDIQLSSGEKLPLSKTKKKLFMEQLSRYWGGII